MIRPGIRVADPDSATLGTVLEFPAVDADGRMLHDMAVVRWDDGVVKILHAGAVWLARSEEGNFEGGPGSF